MMTYVSIILYQECKTKTVFLKRQIIMRLKFFDCYVHIIIGTVPIKKEHIHSLRERSVFYVC